MAVHVRARTSDARPVSAGQRWLVFAHQLPARPSNARVKIWRRLQQIGAVPVKNAVYVLPNSSQALEDLEWLRTEVAGLGGQANVFEASSMTGVEERHIVGQFKALRAGDFAQLTKDVAAVRRRVRSTFRPEEEDLRAIRALRERLDGLRRIDFFSAPGGAKAAAALGALESKGRRPSKDRPSAEEERVDRRDYLRRTWITRPRPGVDRFSSAWLIRRFIDPGAKFIFGGSPEKCLGAVPFDMYQSGGFKHQGDQCTFEVLQGRFGIKDAAARQIGEIVHDLDLKDSRFNSPHGATIGSLVEGLRASIADDGKLLEQGIALFEALYLSLQSGKGRRSGRVPRVPLC